MLWVACSPTGVVPARLEPEEDVPTRAHDSSQSLSQMATAKESSGIEEPSTPVPQPLTNPRVEAESDYEGTSFLLPFDAIRPIYEPVFVDAEEAPYQDDELIMGVALGGEAKAYPVTVLRFREMVNDELAGIPILVSW